MKKKTNKYYHFSPITGKMEKCSNPENCRYGGAHFENPNSYEAQEYMDNQINNVIVDDFKKSILNYIKENQSTQKFKNYFKNEKDVKQFINNIDNYEIITDIKPQLNNDNKDELTSNYVDKFINEDNEYAYQEFSNSIKDYINKNKSKPEIKEYFENEKDVKQFIDNIDNYEFVNEIRPKLDSENQNEVVEQYVKDFIDKENNEAYKEFSKSLIQHIIKNSNQTAYKDYFRSMKDIDEFVNNVDTYEFIDKIKKQIKEKGKEKALRDYVSEFIL